MKKQNDIIKNLEAMAAKLGGEVEVTRYRYIKEAIERGQRTSSPLWHYECP